jgi:8-oxo-dGTP pyrophosphatase MutT (NUDIX family)
MGSDKSIDLNPAQEAKLPTGTTYTHPDVLTTGVTEGWADPETDPSRIDWADLAAAAAFPFEVIDGRPVNPFGPTGIRYGRNELGHWGEKRAADAIVLAWFAGVRHLLLVERDDDHGWAIPGGCLDPGEDALAAAIRELEEETGLSVPGASWRVLPAQYVPDPRASDESWMVTTPAVADLSEVAELPTVTGADDARSAAWVRADSYETLADHLARTYGGTVFAAHVGLLQAALTTTVREAE